MANFFEEVFIRQKLKNKFGIILGVGLAALIGYLLATQFTLGVLVVVGIMGLCALVMCVIVPELALYGLIVFLFFFNFFTRWLKLDVPGGVVYDIILFAGCVGIMVRRGTAGRTGDPFFRKQVPIWFLVWFAYTVLEVANPYSHNYSFWTNAVRKGLEEPLLLFLCFNIFNSPEQIRSYIKVLLFCGVVVGLYAVFQQFHGLLPFEREWATGDPNLFGLLFIQGDFRKFSSFSGPTLFGIDMSCCALLFSLIALNQPPWRRWLLFFGTGSVIWGMIYSGTRTANVIIVAGLGLFILLGLDRKQVRMFTMFAAVTFLFALYVPIYSSQPLNRFRSSFLGKKDASFHLRELDREYAQKFIYGRPFGWGLGSTNGAPNKFAYGTPLDGFQTDDQYLRIGLETGWIGLILFCSLNFVILRMGIRGYFRTRHPTRKVLYAASLAALFAFMIAEFAQEAIGQLECDIIIIPLVALMLRLVQMDKEDAAAAPPEATDTPAS